MASHHIQRLFPSPIIHRCFSSEILLNPPTLTIHSDFAPEYGVPPTQSSDQGSHPVGGALPNATSRVPKPKGEVTRISRDGYNLLTALGWTSDQYTEIQSYLQKLAGKHLDLQSTFKKQNQLKLARFQDEAKKRYPILANYEDDWAASDFLRVYLKNAKARGRKDGDEDAYITTVVATFS
ncbi:hypothetical protein BJ138DRAFT_1120993 [Hygrophoropsis aurantiaca]|uniref:Uncharacterized protein n=1 Tax=Hygrophoropsis aurantiaca TaxID=72124 RepID=A0ACB7ZNY4_9AGAM|nr:hypothetical protein BJ138DRAFT_1120993 [Hygrophoropsis aurantiaca]